MQIKQTAVFVLAILLAACSSPKDPGPLKGTWKMTGITHTNITFRDGEYESMGMIQKVSYKREGNDVLVTSLDGLDKGTTYRYTITGPTTAHSELGDLKKLN